MPSPHEPDATAGIVPADPDQNPSTETAETRAGGVPALALVVHPTSLGGYRIERLWAQAAWGSSTSPATTAPSAPSRSRP